MLTDDSLDTIVYNIDEEPDNPLLEKCILHGRNKEFTRDHIDQASETMKGNTTVKDLILCYGALLYARDIICTNATKVEHHSLVIFQGNYQCCGPRNMTINLRAVIFYLRCQTIGGGRKRWTHTMALR